MYLINSALHDVVRIVFLAIALVISTSATPSCIYDEIPQSIPTECMTVTIQNGNLGALSSVSFSHLNRSTKIKTLTLSDNGITEIGRDTMHNFPALEQLDASKNSIENISKRAFEGLDKLEVLRLDYNQLRNIDSSFSGLTNLNSLNLTFNLITEISSDTFDGITLLHDLFLGYNRLTEIPEALKAGSIQKLEVLNLRSNKINIRLTSSDLQHDYLKELYLTNNGIPGLSGDFFDYLRRLQVLHLDFNRLTNIDGLLVLHQQELQEIKLGHNPWDCNCNDAQVWEQLDNQKIIDRYNTTCSTSKREVVFDFATSCESGLSPASIGIIAASAIIFSGLLIPACICCCWKNCQCFHENQTMNVASSAQPDSETPESWFDRSRCPTPRNRPVISDGHTYDKAQQPKFGSDNYLVPIAMEQRQNDIK